MAKKRISWTYEWPWLVGGTLLAALVVAAIVLLSDDGGSTRRYDEGVRFERSGNDVPVEENALHVNTMKT